MKRTLTLLLSVLMAALLLAGCGSQTSAGSGASPVGADGLSGVIDRIYAQQPVELMVGTTEVDLSDADALKTATGLDSADGIKASAVSEALIGSQAYSLVLVQVTDAAKTEATAKAMQSGINPAKWICVSADQVQLAASGDVILLVMVQSELGISAGELIDAFKTVCGGSVDLTLE